MFRLIQNGVSTNSKQPKLFTIYAKNCYGWLECPGLCIPAIGSNAENYAYAFFLSFAAFLSVHAESPAQHITMSAKNIPLKQVFTVIKKQTGFVVLYNEQLISAAKPVSISAQDMPLLEFLTAVLKNQSIEYTIQGKTIVLSRKPVVVSKEASAIAILQEMGGQDPVKIRITDSAGTPLAGATVAVRSSRISGVTDADGQVSLNVRPGNLLHISFIGHESRTVVVTVSANSCRKDHRNCCREQIASCLPWKFH